MQQTKIANNQESRLMKIIAACCPECNGDYGEWESYDPVAYQVFSVKEWLCQLCYDDFVYGDEEE
mgnify:CR=1 FL=1